jgi:hypothetical protein
VRSKKVTYKAHGAHLALNMCNESLVDIIIESSINPNEYSNVFFSEKPSLLASVEMNFLLALLLL